MKSLAVQTAKATEDISAQILAVQGATNDTVKVFGHIAQRMHDIEERASTVAAAIAEQNAATAKIAVNVSSAANGTNLAVAVLDTAISANAQTRTAAQIVLDTAEAVEMAVGDLRSKIEKFLVSVAAL